MSASRLNHFIWLASLMILTAPAFGIYQEKTILSYPGKTIDDIKFSKTASRIFFTSYDGKGSSAIYYCLLSTGVVVQISPLLSPLGEIYHSYHPRLSPDGRYLAYIRNLGLDPWDDNFKRQIVVFDLQTKIEVVIDETKPGYPEHQFSISEYCWENTSLAFTYTTANSPKQPKSSLITARKRTDTYWFRKILKTNTTHNLSRAIWCPTAPKIAYLIDDIKYLPGNQFPLMKQSLHIVHSNSSVLQLSYDIPKKYPEFFHEIAWDFSQDYIYYRYFSDKDPDHGGYYLGRVNVTALNPFLEDEYSEKVFSETLPDYEADGHIDRFIVSQSSGYLYISREVNTLDDDGSLKLSSQIVQIPYTQPLTWVPITLVNFEYGPWKQIDFSLGSPLLASPNSGLTAYVESKTVDGKSQDQLKIYGDL